MEESDVCNIYYFGPEEPCLKKKYNAEIHWMPLIRVLPINESVKKVLSVIGECDSVVFTSPRGVRVIKELSLEQRLLTSLRNAINKRVIAVIGESTSKALEKEFGIKPHYIPDEWNSYGLGNLLCRIQPKCALLLRAKQSSNILERKLRKCNVLHRKISIYDNIPVTGIIIPKIPVGSPIILSSSMIADAFTKKYGCPDENPVVVLGRITQDVIRKICSGITVYMPKQSLLENAVELAVNICWNNRRNVSKKL
ncbi:MAG: uroporphyrinogen-III synthase [Desulfurococcales archaeon]|nr:uroporphyrinogen-III synthase [Desulfurococcales archaeon]